MSHTVAIDLFSWGWPRRRPSAPEPERPDPLALLRAEFQGAIATEQAARKDLAAQLSATANELKTTREELAESRGYVGMLQRITSTQERTLQEQGSLTAGLLEQQRQATDDKQHQARMIGELRTQMTGQQAEIAELRERIRALTEELATTRNRALVEEAKARILEGENTALRGQVAALTSERDHLLKELERWQQGG